MDDGTVKLLDFGIAKIAASTMTNTGSVLGSAAYMAPEQVAGREIDGRADVFSAGVVLYELLARRKPFEAEAPTAVMMKIVKEDPVPIRNYAPDLPAALVNAVNKALQKDPDKRFMHAGDFGAELRLVRLVARAHDRDDARGSRGRGDDVHPRAVHGGVRRRRRPRRAAGARDARRPRGRRVAPRRDGARPAASKGGGRFATWIAVAAVAVAAVLAAVVLVQRNGAPGGAARRRRPRGRRDRCRGSRPRSGRHAGLVRGREARDRSRGRGRVDRRQRHRPDHAGRRGRRRSVGAARCGSRRRASARPTCAPPRRRSGSGVVLVKMQAAVEGMAVNVSGSYPFEVLEGSRVISASSTRHSLNLPGPTTLRLRSGEYLLDQPLRADSASGRVSYTLPRGRASHHPHAARDVQGRHRRARPRLPAHHRPEARRRQLPRGTPVPGRQQQDGGRQHRARPAANGNHPMTRSILAGGRRLRARGVALRRRRDRPGPRHARGVREPAVRERPRVHEERTDLRSAQGFPGRRRGLPEHQRGRRCAAGDRALPARRAPRRRDRAGHRREHRQEVPDLRLDFVRLRGRRPGARRPRPDRRQRGRGARQLRARAPPVPRQRGRGAVALCVGRHAPPPRALPRGARALRPGVDGVSADDVGVAGAARRRRVPRVDGQAARGDGDAAARRERLPEQPAGRDRARLEQRALPALRAPAGAAALRVREPDDRRRRAAS